MRQTLSFEVAEAKHLQAIVRLLADDKLGVGRETTGENVDACYHTAFEAIDADPNNEVIVALMADDVVGTLQISYSANLTLKGTLRGTIEGVRVSSQHRSAGIGTQMFQWAIARCKARGCGIVQLTSDLKRGEAIAFYQQLGFKHSHAGMKLRLDSDQLTP